MVLTLLMLMPTYRSLFGPTVLDRLLGVNAIGSRTIVMLILTGLIYGRVDMFVDIALAVEDLLSAAILFGAYSFMLCLLWAIMGAVDVAFTEAGGGRASARCCLSLPYFKPQGKPAIETNRIDPAYDDGGGC